MKLSRSAHVPALGPLAAVLAALSMLSAPAPARAQGEARSAQPPKSAQAAPRASEPNQQTKDEARRLGRQALKLMREERWAEAQAMLAKAYRMVPAPTIALLEGRALEHMGRLVDAAARYEAAMRAEVGPDSPKAFGKAMKEALEELERLDPRIPRLKIVVAGAAPQRDVIVRLDQQPVAQTSLANPMRVDPGEHVVSASAEGFTAVEQRVQLAERESKEIVLSLVPAPARSPAPAPPVTEPADETPVASTPVDSGPSPALGWTALGIGVAGLTVGVVAGVLMLDAKAALDEECRGTCPESAESDLSRFRTMRTVSAVGYVAGAVGVAAGAALLLVSGSSSTDTGATPVRPFIGVRSAGVEGAF